MPLEPPVATTETRPGKQPKMALDFPALQVDPLPPRFEFNRDSSVPHAPRRPHTLNSVECRRAVKNALRYFPTACHAELALEFARELDEYGHIYMYRFRPVGRVFAQSIDSYPAKCRQAAGIMLMIQNNLDPEVAQFPHELVTYGGNGTVFQNWAQYHLTMHYLQIMEEDQTLAMYSGHPMGLFPSHPDAPRVIITNGMVIPNYSTIENYNKMFAMGVTQYGQMTAGSYCYIGSQGIVHGTAITLFNAGRLYLNVEDLKGKLFVTAGLGGMSGAQPKAASICQAVSITAEVSEAALMKRVNQGWLDEYRKNTSEIIQLAREALVAKQCISLGYLGNVVDLWEALVEADLTPDLGSDQTSLHNPFGGGYYPVGVTYEEGNHILATDPARFKGLVEESLVRHVAAVNKLAAKGMRFWDYGNAFLLQASRAGADIVKDQLTGQFRYPSYFEDIMGDVFSLGFGPYRWVCLSNNPADLEATDRIAAEELERLLRSGDVPKQSISHYRDNLTWIRTAGPNKLVVGSQARILYADCPGRVAIAVAMNNAVASGILQGPVAISRDHHDVSGTDSPYRETANIIDGSRFTADMAVHTFVGNACRGATWVSLHNGGGVGWGEVINGGFGLILDGTPDAERRARAMLHWDVTNGMARRCWSENANAGVGISQAMKANAKLNVT
ncbi:Urocanate hydratase, putative [Perkinsus marinus ATCC 50983]|uniref:urocanate hydratase n=1 Tax=Perkinsus marinus (strain ATCC 50983 / TXsc) TaxID=423536 RepID=C5KD95_PERM5|nr:Urocanate hydratase, putative [Perkinsus marinus ATCC 50983]EER17528.1 Urocanate hydratase, putative [Perkinsus marinus ATCC 50983]|eukprot:XP_002785732.1 Urocanate hydratase, putative [Perkinsus marinus ATCC 50983]